MSITGLHIPYGDGPLDAVSVDEKNVVSYYPFVQGGPVEAGQLSIQGLDLKVYVNSRYSELRETMINPRASALFEMAGAGMYGGAVRGDALAVLAAGTGHLDRSLPPDVIAFFLATDSDD